MQPKPLVHSPTGCIQRVPWRRRVHPPPQRYPSNTKSFDSCSTTRRLRSICNSTRSSNRATGTFYQRASASRVSSGGPTRRWTFGVTSSAGSCSSRSDGPTTRSCGTTGRRRTKWSRPFSSFASKCAWSCRPCTTRSPVAQKRTTTASWLSICLESPSPWSPSTSVEYTTRFGARTWVKERGTRPETGGNNINNFSFQTLRNFYICTVGLIFVVCLVLQIPKLNVPTNIKTLTFVLWAAYGIIPTAHWAIVMGGFENAMVRVSKY